MKNDADQFRFHQQHHAEGAIFCLHGNIVVEVRRCIVVFTPSVEAEPRDEGSATRSAVSNVPIRGFISCL